MRREVMAGRNHDDSLVKPDRSKFLTFWAKVDLVLAENERVMAEHREDSDEAA